jgi:hypothetical protein
VTAKPLTDEKYVIQVSLKSPKSPVGRQTLPDSGKNPGVGKKTAMTKKDGEKGNPAGWNSLLPLQK